LLLKIRNMTALSGEALWRNPNLKAGLGFSRSVTSAIMLGALPATALQDVISITFTTGLRSVFTSLAPRFLRFFTSRSFREISKKDLRSLGFFVDCAINKSMGRLGEDSIDPTLMSRLERVGEKLRNFSYRYSGAEAVLETVHDVAVPTVVLDILRIGRKIKAGEGLSVAELHQLNFARLNQEKLLKILDQFDRFGVSEEEGALQLNLENWEDVAAREDMIYAVNTTMDRAILNPGHETPTFGPFWNVFWQFKRFAFAAYDRFLLPTMQRLADWELSLMGKIIASILLGSLRDVLDRTVEGRDMPSAEELLIYGISKSDLLPFIGDWVKNLHDGFSAHEALPTMLGRGLKDFFVPPSASQLQNFAIAGQNGITKLLGGETPISKRDASAIRHSILFNNHYLFRRVFHNWQEALANPRN
jgi:hypothetical protein